jgi:hypothetical protein
MRVDKSAYFRKPTNLRWIIAVASHSPQAFSSAKRKHHFAKARRKRNDPLWKLLLSRTLPERSNGRN